MPARTPLSDSEIAAALPDLPGWSVVDGRLAWSHDFGTFRSAFAFLVRLAFEAEALDHHPEITNVYGRVALTLATHDADDRVTETDLALARRIAGLLEA